ncbi:MAG: VWA domain-containing protein [Syntrophomonadaceae bacterium]|jgi:Ca-activated chloride channel family protein|nr:VWA domain-containing protein [Syntrophomonadaceae bacterium]
MDQNKQIKVELALDKTFLTAGRKHTAFVMVKLTAPELPAKDRPAQNLSFVIDRSGSMAGEKLNYTKKATVFALGHLGGEDYCSIVTFDDQVDLLYPAALAKNKDLLKRGVESLYPGGCTNLSGGFLKGFGEVKKYYQPERINRVLLLTDGMANTGVIEPGDLVKLTKEVATSGITVSTFGLGDDFQEDLLKEMAEAGKGNFYYIASPDQIPSIFEQELSGLLSIVAQNIRVKAKPAPGVTITGVLGYPPDNGDGLNLTLPDLYSSETKVLVFTLAIADLFEGESSLLELEIEYADVRQNLAMVNLQANLKTNIRADGEEPLDNLEVIKQVEIFRAAEVREEAVQLADRGDFEGSRRLLEKQLHKISNLAHDLADEELTNEANDLKDCLNRIMMYPNDYKSLRKHFVCEAFQVKMGRRQKKKR